MARTGGHATAASFRLGDRVRKVGRDDPGEVQRLSPGGESALVHFDSGRREYVKCHELVDLAVDDPGFAPPDPKERPVPVAQVVEEMSAEGALERAPDPEPPPEAEPAPEAEAEPPAEADPFPEAAEPPEPPPAARRRLPVTELMLDVADCEDYLDALHAYHQVRLAEVLLQGKIAAARSSLEAAIDRLGADPLGVLPDHDVPPPRPAAANGAAPAEAEPAPPVSVPVVVDPLAQRMLAALPMTTQQLVDRFDVSETTVRRVMRRLEADLLVVTSPVPNPQGGRPQTRWALAGEGA